MPEDADALLVRLLAQIAPEVDLQLVDRDEPLQHTAGLDSVDFINLIAALYAETGIDVPEHDYPRLASVGGFVDYVERRRARAEPIPEGAP